MSSLYDLFSAQTTHEVYILSFFPSSKKWKSRNYHFEIVKIIKESWFYLKKKVSPFEIVKITENLSFFDQRWHLVKLDDTFFFKSVIFENHHNLRGFEFFDPKVTLLMKIFTPWASYEIFSKRKNSAKKYFIIIV